jgi:glucose/arabinose dehydrogenase
MLFTSLILITLLQQEADYYSVEHFTTPEGEYLEVGGMDFSSDGTLWVSTRRGRVWRIENALADDPADARFTIFAEGLHEGLGLKVVDDVVHVAQRGELSRLLDLDGDGRCDRIETISQDWGMSGNYHEFAFGLPRDAEGNFYMSTNVGFWSPEWWHGLSKVPHRGWVLKIAPDGTTTPIASGVRSPCGLGLTADGLLLYTDNQGDWMPVCGIFPVEQGGFLGHPASLRWTEHYGNGAEVPSSTVPPDVERTPAAIWLPYEWSRSTGNLEPGPVEGFGPFGTQLFVAELTNGMVLRADMEQVQGVWQGVCFPFRQEVGSICRVVFAPDGSLFTGFTNRGWGGLGPGGGLARIRYQGDTPFEMQTVKIREDGFVVSFTAPLPEGAEPQIALRAYDYNWWWDYGSPEMRSHALEVEAVEIAADRLSMRLRVPELEPGWCVRGTLEGVGLLHTDFAYTVNQMPGRAKSTVQIAKQAAPPAAKSDTDSGWLMTTWQDPFDAWTGEGWALADVEIDPDASGSFRSTPGNGALWNPGPNPQDFRSKAEYGDLDFRFRFMLPEGGDSGLYFMDRYELQLCDKPGECGGVYGVKNPRARAYNGPGIWHEIQGRFRAPRFDAAGNKVQDARFEDIAIDGVAVLGSAECAGPTGGGAPGEVARGPLRFQANMGNVALADIRVRPIEEEDNSVAASSWTPAFGEQLPEGALERMILSPAPTPYDFELQASLAIGDGGAAELHFRDNGDIGYVLRLDSTGTGDARSGSIAGLATVRTQFIPAGVEFDLRLRCEAYGPNVRIRVWLNEMLVVDVEDESPPPPGGLRLQPLGRNDGLQIRAARVRKL